MSPISAGGGANIIAGGEHISPASLKRQEEVLPTAKLEQRRYNDSRINWDARLCPIHGDTEREQECSKSVTAAQVIEAIERLWRDRQ